MRCRTIDLPVVVLTHNPPQEWVNNPASPFTFVTDGIESAVAKAKAIAGDKDVELGTASTLQQALKAGLVDELHIDIVPVVLGEGVRLFEQLGKLPLVLEQVASVEGQGVTHISYRIVK